MRPCLIRVVPLVGTWIEIAVDVDNPNLTAVVPLVGTWIEIRKHPKTPVWTFVVPLVGTWIEICGSCPKKRCNKSSPSWGRGLKFPDIHVARCKFPVVPLVGTWIEICLRSSFLSRRSWSSPSWGRGLKLNGKREVKATE